MFVIAAVSWAMEAVRLLNTNGREGSPVIVLELNNYKQSEYVLLRVVDSWTIKTVLNNITMYNIFHEVKLTATQQDMESISVCVCTKGSTCRIFRGLCRVHG